MTGQELQRGRSPLVVLLIVSVALSATANNFASRIKAELLGDYNFVTVVPDSFLQLVFNLVALGIQMARHRVHPAQCRYLFACGKSWTACGAWKLLALAGVNDIANNVTGLAAQPHLTTFTMSLTDQATTPFTVVFSVLLLGTRYIALEWVSILVIIAAAISCVVIVNSVSDPDDSRFWAIFAAVTTSFAALSFVLKEITFTGYKAFWSRSGNSHRSFGIQLPNSPPDQLSDEQHLQRRLHEPNGGPSCPANSDSLDTLNVFLVGAFINFVGLLFSVPIALLNHSAVSSGSSWLALTDGLQMLWQKEHALTAYFVYIAINTLFNVALILTTSNGSALLSFLSLKAAVPLTAILSAVPWPVIGAKPLHEAEWLALLVLIAGITAFRIGNLKRLGMEAATGAEPVC
mmetsp:Transcript_51616/g.167666  ORF Transcript_51616/g.167666 Transcript_51616/m.167666 type:complete len:404 (+) Transcript_51616:68-1279(+)